MGETRIVKRYANRKLYDTQRSRYVTLEQIADMIRSGEDVKIVNNNSKDDLTSVTLAQIIFEEEKKQKSFLPLQAMRNIIQSGGESLQELASQAGAKMRQVFGRDKGAGEGGAGEGEAPPDEAPPAEPPSDEGAKADAKAEGGAAHAINQAIKEFVERSQQTF